MINSSLEFISQPFTQRGSDGWCTYLDYYYNSVDVFNSLMVMALINLNINQLVVLIAGLQLYIGWSLLP